MADQEEKKASESSDAESSEESAIVAGEVSSWLSEQGFDHEVMERDHSGVEVLKIDPELLFPFASALYAYGFNYLRCQCAYDAGPGKELVSVYDLTKLSDDADAPAEVRIKCFLPRDNPRVPSMYWIWKSADWQERECYDLFGIIYEGHPNLKRLLMPEDWEGYPLRKDYISPDFYELQDAY